MPRVKNMKTGAVFNANPRLLALAERRQEIHVIDDGRKLDDADKAELAKIANTEVAGADPEQVANGEFQPPPSGEGVSNQTDGEGSGENAASQVDADEMLANVKSLRGKDALEKIILENYGVNLDKRKTLANMKEEAAKIIQDAGGAG